MQYNIQGVPEPIRKGNIAPEDYLFHYVDKAYKKYGDENATYAMQHGMQVSVVGDNRWAMTPVRDDVIQQRFGVSPAEVAKKESMFRQQERAFTQAGRSLVGATFGGQMDEADYTVYGLALTRLGYKTERDGNQLIVSGKWKE